MASGQFEYQSDFARKFRGEGETKGKATSVLTVLKARGIAISDEQRTRVLSCTDLGQLDRWLEKAVVVPMAEQLFVD